MTILECLKKGKENALSLKYIMAVCKLSDRAARDEISRINSSGQEIICNYGNGKGYFIAASEKEANDYIAFCESYCISGWEKVNAMKKCKERKYSGQLALPETIKP